MIASPYTAMIKKTLFLILGTLFLASCSDEKETTVAPDPNLEKIAALESRLEGLRDESARERARHREQMAANADMLGDLRDLLVTLNSKPAPEPESVPEPVEKKLEELEKTEEIVPEPITDEIKVDKLAESFRSARLLAEGEEYDFLETTSGERYQDVVISEVTDIGISIRHRGGAARVPFEELPATWQDRFGYDPLRSERALQRERVAQARYQRSASREFIAQQERADKVAREIREARLALAIADANRPAVAPLPADLGVVDDIPVRQTIFSDPYFYNDYYYRPTLDVPSLHVPFLHPGINSLPSIPTHRPPVVRPPIVRPPSSPPIHNEAITRPPITRPPTPAPSRPQISRPAPQPQTQRPSRPTQGTVTQQPRMVR